MSATEDLYAQLKREAKKANQRLVRLEHTDNITPAYKIAKNNIQNVLGKESGKPRFSYRKSMDYNEMQHEMKYINQFNKSASSTATGMKAVVKKRDATLTKKFGATKLNPLYKILSSESYKKLSELVPSSMVVQSISDALNRGAKPRSITSSLKKLIGQESDEYLVDSMNDMLDSLK